MGSSAANDPEQAAATQKTAMQALTLGAVCLGTLCIVPTICWMRRTVEKRYDFMYPDPMWKTGLIACCAWPCALTQMQDEMNRYDHNHHSLFSHSYYNDAIHHDNEDEDEDEDDS